MAMAMAVDCNGLALRETNPWWVIQWVRPSPTRRTPPPEPRLESLQSSNGVSQALSASVSQCQPSAPLTVCVSLFSPFDSNTATVGQTLPQIWSNLYSGLKISWNLKNSSLYLNFSVNYVRNPFAVHNWRPNTNTMTSQEKMYWCEWTPSLATDSQPWTRGSKAVTTSMNHFRPDLPFVEQLGKSIKVVKQTKKFFAITWVGIQF